MRNNCEGEAENWARDVPHAASACPYLGVIRHVTQREEGFMGASSIWLDRVRIPPPQIQSQNAASLDSSHPHQRPRPPRPQNDGFGPRIRAHFPRFCAVDM